MKTLIFVLLLALALSACAPAVALAPAATTALPSAPTETPILPSAPTATPVQNGPITLRLAGSDKQDAPSAPSIQEFVDQVKELSGGNIIIQPVWEAAGSQSDAAYEQGEITGVKSYEQGVIAAVKSGDYELGLAGSRAFDLEGVTSFQALQTPFLIDSDALAIAVAQSDVAVQMLDGISAQGLSGLTLWPEDLRHPFSVVPGKPLISPGDLTGENIRTLPSGISYALIEALGGKPMMAASNYQGAEFGLRQGFSLTGTPIATGNVVFFPKFQVLFANGKAFDQLSEAQRSILGKAAAATQAKAISIRPNDTEASVAWCADGSSIVLASDEQVAAFVEVAQPVIDQIEADPANAELVAAIREIKANTQAGPVVPACGVVATQPAADDGEQTWSAGLPPNGDWQVELTNEDVVRMGVKKSDVGDWAGRWTWTFQDGNAHLLGEVEVGDPIPCKATYEVVGDIVQLTYFDSENCYGAIDDIQWRLDDDGLHLHLVAIENAHYIENKAVYEAKPWQKIADTAALPAEPAVAPWSLVAVGDSIPYNSPDDCRGCTGFVDRYAAAITQATGHPVEVQNLSKHNGLQTDGLLEELKTDVKRREALANADIIIVSIGGNDMPWNRNDDPCDGPSSDNIEWSKFNPTCAAEAAEIFRPKFESVFAQIVALRAGKPTIFLTTNRYNDWIGLRGGVFSAEDIEATHEVFEAWNAMVCKAAQENGFTCGDIYHAFNGPDGLAPAPAFIANDTIHPSNKGNEVIAGVLADLGYAPLVP